MAGTWSSLQNQPNFNADTMLLLTNGTVMCHEVSSRNWHKLTPDSSGDYVKGSWSSISSLPNNSVIPKTSGGPTNAPLYFASAVLGDGTVFVAGGEDNSGIKSVEILAAQIYDPVSDSWTTVKAPTGWTQIGDAPSCVLPDGKLLLGNINSTSTAIYDPKSATWTAAANKGDNSGEETFTLLPDNTVLTVQCSNSPNAEKYIIATDQWVSAGSTPSTLPQVCPVSVVGEIGPAILLPDGRVFAIGATGNTALYTVPSTTTDKGSWASGPTLKDKSGNTSFPMDAGAVLLPNGKVLCVGSPSPPCSYPKPTTFFEYDPSTNTASVVTSPSNGGNPCYTGRFLLLPSGQVLFSDNTKDIEVYTPDGHPNPSWKPTITNCPNAMNLGDTYSISGTQLNGLSQAVSYGDDAQMATNYPIVQLKNTATGKVVYCRTFNHSTMGVATGRAIVTTNVQVHGGMPTGEYNLVVIANGIASDPVRVTIAQECLKFGTIMVPANQGWWWYWGQTGEQVGQLIAQNHAMLTDISPYRDTDGSLKFAVIMQPDTGQGWWWYWGQTGEQVGQLIAQNHAMLTDISPYRDTDGSLKFAIIMRPDTGQGWWWYWGQTGEQVGQLIAQNHAMLTDISPYWDTDGSLKFAIIMRPDTGQGWWWYWGLDGDGISRALNENNARLTALAPYIDCG